MRFILLAAAFSVAQPNASLRPVTVTCFADDPGLVALWGPMRVTVDEQARHVHIEPAPGSPAVRVDYWDGAFASISTGQKHTDLPDELVQQFVRVTPASIDVGWYDSHGVLQHYSSFNRAALHSRWIMCRWHAYGPLGAG